MRNTLIIIFYIFLSSCSTPKFYKEINALQNEIKKEIELKNNHTKSIKARGDDYNKLVLRKLRKELKNTNHIVYYSYSDSDSFSFTIKKKWFIIYDFDNDIYYSLENLEGKLKKIEVIDVSNVLKDDFDQFIFDNYLKGNCDLLIEKGNVSMSGVRSYEAVYDIDLKNGLFKKCYFRNFMLIRDESHYQ
jgi:hypothetical protein